MNPALTVARKEYDLALRSLGTYIVFAIYLLAAGLYFGLTALRVQLAELRGIFGFMHTLFLVFVPALTMGSLARESTGGTLELLYPLPLRLSHIVWGKFLAAWLQLATLLAFTLVFLGLIVVYGSGVDFGAVLTGYLGLLCAGAAFTAIGIFASSVSPNQVLAFILALALSGILFLLGRVGDLIPLKLLSAVEFLGFDYHLDNFLKGVIDTRDLLYFAVVTYVFILLAQLRLQAQNMLQER